MEPLLSMFNSIMDLAKAPVNSPEASFILYMLSLAVGVEAYIIYAIRESWLPPALKTPELEVRPTDVHTHIAVVDHQPSNHSCTTHPQRWSGACYWQQP
jgi:hypothetical protein